MTTTNFPACPGCGKPLQKVKQSPNSMLNAEQFDAVRAGDWFCETCPGNGRAAGGYRYFWDGDLSIRSPATEETPRADRTEPWTDEQRANYRANQALVYRCVICCARSGEPHLPSCPEGKGDSGT